MKNKKQNHGNKWNARFVPRQAHAEITEVGNGIMVIRCCNATDAALIRIAGTIEREMFCMEASLLDGDIRMYNCDHGMMACRSLPEFLVEAFEQEGYELTVSGPSE